MLHLTVGFVYAFKGSYVIYFPDPPPELRVDITDVDIIGETIFFFKIGGDMIELLWIVCIT